MPAEMEPLAFRIPLTVTVRSAAAAAVSVDAHNDAVTTDFQIIFVPPHHPPQLSPFPPRKRGREGWELQGQCPPAQPDLRKLVSLSGVVRRPSLDRIPASRDV